MLTPPLSPPTTPRTRPRRHTCKTLAQSYRRLHHRRAVVIAVHDALVEAACEGDLYTVEALASISTAIRGLPNDDRTVDELWTLGGSGLVTLGRVLGDIADTSPATPESALANLLATMRTQDPFTLPLTTRVHQWLNIRRLHIGFYWELAARCVR